MTLDVTARILAVNHDTAVLVALASALEPSQIVAAPIDREVVAITREVQPDVILVDVTRQSGAGFEATRRLKSDPSAGRVPLLALARMGKDEAARALQSGADDYVTTPFDRCELRSRVGTHIERHRLRTSLDAGPAGVAWSEVLGRVCPEIASRILLIEESTRLLGKTAGESDRETIGKVLSAAQRISDLVAALTSCASSRPCGRSLIDLGSVVRLAVRVTQGALAQDSGVWIEVREPVPRFPIVGDSRLLTDALAGVILHAGDLLPLGGRVAIVGRRSHGRVVVALECREEPVRARRPNPVIGSKGRLKLHELRAPDLTAARFIIEEQGGCVEVEDDDSVGIGPVFRFTFPLA